MRIVCQRVRHARVLVDDEEVASIDAGLLLYAGIGPNDTHKDVAHAAERIAGLRIFPDNDAKMNVSTRDAQAQALVVSQFTLFADTHHGHRPSFLGSGPPDMARPLVDHFVDCLRKEGVPACSGVFGAHMEVESTNWGPITLVLTTSEQSWLTDIG